MDSNRPLSQSKRPMKMRQPVKLYDLLDGQDIDAVFAEISHIMGLSGAEAIEAPFSNVYQDVVRLFRGEYSGYQASNTKYHNLEHTLMVTLATARLIHGCAEAGFEFDTENILTGLLAALYHDVGLIQADHDKSGTGAKYTIGHEKRSVAFMRSNLAHWAFTSAQMNDCAALIKCTNLKLEVSEIGFRDQSLALIGKIVGSSDLLAQIADRQYLEKLFLLFKEFEEAGIPGFVSESELLEKTEDFYHHVARKRLYEDFGGLCDYMRVHFRKRWEIDRDLYAEAINHNIEYLKEIMNAGGSGRDLYRDFLKRGRIRSSDFPEASE